MSQWFGIPIMLIGTKYTMGFNPGCNPRHQNDITDFMLIPSIFMGLQTADPHRKLSPKRNPWNLSSSPINFSRGLLIIDFPFIRPATKPLISGGRSRGRLTSQEKKHPANFILPQVWNDTVANLTLMALGSSAPEILSGDPRVVRVPLFPPKKT